MNPTDVLEAASAAAKATAAAIEKKPIEALAHALDAVMAIARPDEDLSVHLSLAAVRRQKRLKEIADDAKFGTDQ